MKDGAEVRDLEELERAFDPDAIMKYFKSEQLETWLRERYYDDAADAISAVAKDDPNAAKKICAALSIPYEDHFDKEFAARIREKRKQLQEMTSDVSIIENARNTAFNQEDLADLLDLDESVIYLCGKKFTVPIRIENKRYVGVLGTPLIDIKAASKEELDAKHIVFENVELPSLQKAVPPENNFCTRKLEIRTPPGINAILQTLKPFYSKVRINSVDATSLASLMGLDLGRGSKITVRAAGSDADRAVEALSKLFGSYAIRDQHNSPSKKSTKAAKPSLVPD